VEGLPGSVGERHGRDMSATFLEFTEMLVSGNRPTLIQANKIIDVKPNCLGGSGTLISLEGQPGYVHVTAEYAEVRSLIAGCAPIYVVHTTVTSM